jgi:hypothetical protein
MSETLAIAGEARPRSRPRSASDRPHGGDGCRSLVRGNKDRTYPTISAKRTHFWREPALPDALRPDAPPRKPASTSSTRTKAGRESDSESRRTQGGPPIELTTSVQIGGFGDPLCRFDQTKPFRTRAPASRPALCASSLPRKRRKRADAWARKRMPCARHRTIAVNAHRHRVGDSVDATFRRAARCSCEQHCSWMASDDPRGEVFLADGGCRGSSIHIDRALAHPA